MTVKDLKTDKVVNDITGFILRRRYWLRTSGVKRSEWRIKTAQEFMNHESYKSGIWTSIQFVSIYNILKSREVV